MPVSAQVSSNSSLANGVTTVFPYAFKIVAAADVKVVVADATKVLNVDYTVSGVGNDAGGNVTFTVAPANGATVVRSRNMAYSRGIDYQNNGDLLAQTLDDDQDAPVLMIQQLAEQIGRAILLAPGSALSGLTFPGPGAGLFMRWNLAGTALETVASLDAGNTNFLQSGAGAVLRTTSSKMGDVVSAKDFGAVGDNVNDDTAAIQAALNCGARGIYLPAGVYKTTAALTIPANVSVLGAGMYSTFIVPATIGQTVFSRINGALASASITIQDLGIECATVTGITGVQFTLCQFTSLVNVSFGGCSRNFDIDRGNTHTITGCVSRGNAALKAGNFRVWSSSDADYVYNARITDYQIRNLGNGVTGTPAACYFRRAIGSFLTGLHSNDASAGGAITLVLFENDCQGCRLVNGISGAADITVQFSIGAGVVVAPSFCSVDNFESDQCVTRHIDMPAGNWLRINNCNFTASGVGTGIAAIYANGSTRVLISGCHFNGFNTGNGAAVAVNTPASDVVITGNIIEDCVRGIWPTTTSPVGLRVLENTFLNVTTPLYSPFPLTGGSGNLIRGNRGANFAATTPAMPASTVAVTNVQGHTMRIYIAGGTTTVVTVAGVVTGRISPCDIILNPDETIAITYTVAPTWVWQTMA